MAKRHWARLKGREKENEREKKRQTQQKWRRNTSHRIRQPSRPTAKIKKHAHRMQNENKIKINTNE